MGRMSRLNSTVCGSGSAARAAGAAASPPSKIAENSGGMKLKMAVRILTKRGIRCEGQISGRSCIHRTRIRMDGTGGEGHAFHKAELHAQGFAGGQAPRTGHEAVAFSRFGVH